MTRELLYVEMDCPKCSANFGVSPCAATGVQCKKTPATCKDPVNYQSGAIQTVRWVKSAAYAPITPYAVPNINSVSVNSQRINPAENLGKRERVTATFFNHRHNDVDLDPYYYLRDYNPYERGTYWGKFAAMYPNVQGYPVRVARGDADSPYADFVVSHYVADVGKIEGDNTGYSLVAKDVLDFAEGNKTLCPSPSVGILAANITAASGSVTLAPAGVGAKYPGAFDASIGNECVVCSRSGDVITFTQRGAYSSVAADHNEGDTLQVMESFVTQDVAQILARLLMYTDTPIDYYNESQWAQQVAIVSSPSVTARIATPTPVFELIQDLMRDFALDIHTDVIAKKVIMKFLILQAPSAEISDENMDNPTAKFYEDKRVDLCFFSFGRKNPLLKMDEQTNYPVTIVRPTDSPAALLSGNPAAIKKHNSRWIPAFLRTQASKAAEFILGRYQLAPRGLVCTMPTAMAPALSQLVNVTTSVFEDEFGAMPTIQMQVVSCSTGQGNSQLELEELRTVGYDPDNPNIVISLVESALNMTGYASMRALFNSVYPGAIPANAVVRFEADNNVVFGSSSTGNFSVIMGDWPEVAANNLTIQIVGLVIAGRGGDGGIPGANGSPGGPGFYTRAPVELIDFVLGGGGGGGGSGLYYTMGNTYYAVGGGGAGSQGGNGWAGGNGSLYTGGAGQNVGPVIGGRGGDLGQAGSASPASGGTGGAAGLAVDGLSYCTISGTTTVYGAAIN